jgi:hypothetical protein
VDRYKQSNIRDFSRTNARQNNVSRSLEWPRFSSWVSYLCTRQKRRKYDCVDACACCIRKYNYSTTRLRVDWRKIRTNSERGWLAGRPGNRGARAPICIRQLPFGRVKKVHQIAQKCVCVCCKLPSYLLANAKYLSPSRICLTYIYFVYTQLVLQSSPAPPCRVTLKRPMRLTRMQVLWFWILAFFLIFLKTLNLKPFIIKTFFDVKNIFALNAAHLCSRPTVKATDAQSPPREEAYIYTKPCKPPHGRVAGGVRTTAVWRMGGVEGEDVLGKSCVCRL